MTLIENEVLRVGAGTRWVDVIRFLDARQRAVLVMQSDADFSVGGTISVNAHGWTPRQPPIGGSVNRLRIVTADGRCRWCSRTQNSELFSLVIGGYGLFGVIVEAELRNIPNVTYRIDTRVVSQSELFDEFPDPAPVGSEGRVGLQYARLDPRPTSRFQTAIHVRYFREDGEALQPMQSPGLLGLRRAVFRGSVGSRYGKRLRWNLERAAALASNDTLTTRTSVMSDTSDVILNHSEGVTDILHEYFVPAASVHQFLAEADALVTEHGADLLNVTVRDVRGDTDSFLRWATEDVVAFVMYFHQEKTPEAEASMAALTRALISRSLQLGGRYYLPYRRHATEAQLLSAYPMWPTFVAAKHKYDPRLRFRNKFFNQYEDVGK